LAALLAALCSRGSSAADLDTSWIDRSALNAGTILVTTDRGDRPQIVHVRVAAQIDAPIQAIWDVLKACEIAPEYVPDVVNCRSLQVLDEGSAELFVQTVKPAFFVPSFEHVFRLDYTPYSRIDVHRVSGPIAVMEATWWLLPEPTGKITLIYDLAIDPGMPVPRVFVRATLKRDLPRLLRAVRERAESAR
jgi:hypothetical protein